MLWNQDFSNWLHSWICSAEPYIQFLTGIKIQIPGKMVHDKVRKVVCSEKCMFTHPPKLHKISFLSSQE